jgi:serine/threonine protein kinase
MFRLSSTDPVAEQWMYWTSPLVGKAVALELVPARKVERVARRVRHRAGDQPAHDLLWADELVRARLLTRYQSQALLNSVQPASTSARESSVLVESPLKIGSFVVTDRIGRSDIGTTYRANRAGETSSFAIKTIRRCWISNDTDWTRLVSELDRWEQLSDARVVVPTPMDMDNGFRVLVSHWVGSSSLADTLRTCRRLSTSAAVAMIYELIRLLAMADARGLVHGNVRPSNIMLDGWGRVRLLDCGVRRAIPAARLSVQRDLPPHQYDYLAPELADGSAAPDAVSDIYSIGCLFYHLICGRPPYFGGSAERKCALHKSGKLLAPESLGIQAGPEARRVLDATVQPDRARRIGSYNDLLSWISPDAMKKSRRVPVGAGRAPMWPSLKRGHRQAAAPASSNALARWLVGTATAAATAVAVLHGSSRLLPLLSLRPSNRSSAITLGGGSRPAPPTRPAQQASTVTTLWNATEDLRAAYRDAAPNDTITLQSPGPFLIDAIEINKPITLRGADNIRPLFLGGPGSALRVTGADVRMQNIHFVCVGDRLADQSDNESHAMLEVTSHRLTIERCSFHNVSGRSKAGISWSATGAHDAPANLSLHNVLWRDVSAAIDVSSRGGAQIELQNCVHLGPGPLLRTASGPAQPFEALEVNATGVTVFGATTCEHSFPHPLDDAAALKIIVRESLLVPRDRNQPVLSVHYATKPTTLMPRVLWSGSSSICPADATVLEVSHGADASPWRASDVAAWQKYWGTRGTGLLGARLDFAASVPSSLSDIPVPRLRNQAAPGANVAEMCYPLPIALEQLPLLLQRLDSR